jgi:hypothetical protein
VWAEHGGRQGLDVCWVTDVRLAAGSLVASDMAPCLHAALVTVPDLAC